MISQLLSTHYDAVVIGSGHNGLVAAAYLAAAGQSVLILERSPVAGGATTSQQVFPDYDARLSRYSYLVSLLPQQIVDELKLTFETRRRRTASFTPWTDKNGVHRGLVISNADAERSRASMRELTGDNSAWSDYQRLLELESVIAGIAWPSLLHPLQHRTEFQSGLKSRNELEAWEAFIERPLGETIERFAQNDILRGLLMTDGKIGVLTHPHDDSLLQNRCFLYHVIGNGTGEWRVPVGGMGALANALIQRCRTAGVVLQTNAAAVAIHPGEAHHTVVFHHDDRLQQVDATRVLVNAGPRTFARLLNQSWNPTSADEGSVIKMNMLLHRLPEVRAGGVTSNEAFTGSFHVDEGYEQMQASFRTASAGQIPEPAPAEMYCHTLTDSSILSPELQAKGYHTLTLFGLDMPYRLFRENHDERLNRVQQIYIDALDRICREPFMNCVATDRDGRPCIEIHSPQQLEAELDLDLGNIFHKSLAWFFTDDWEQAGKWGVETHFPRIYRAGSSAHRGGAVSGIPGRNAAMCILDEIEIKMR